MKIIGVDPGVKNVGIATMEFGEELKVDVMTITADDTKIGKERLFHLVESAYVIIEDGLKNEKNRIIFIEDYAFGSKHLNLEEVEGMGILLYLFHTHSKKTTFYLIAPSSMKKLVTGNGRATKSMVKRALINKYPQFKNEDSHSFDALGLAEFYKVIISDIMYADTVKKVEAGKVILGVKDV